MKTLLAKSAGFCWGVRRAVEMAERQTTPPAGAGTPPREGNLPGKIYTDGPLIHNSHQTELLEKSGVWECADPATLEAGAVLLIRAHGISPERRKWLESLPLKLVDATCPDVAKIHGIVSKRAAEGATVLVYGDAGHAEVVGLLGCAGEGGRMVTSSSDVARVSRPAHGNGGPGGAGRVVLVSQTTQSPEDFAEVAAAVKTRYPEAEIIDTICRATKTRQSELRELAAKCDAIVVIGSPESANTQRLAQTAAALRKTVVVDSAEELRDGDFAGIGTVGVTAGASTPDFIIEAVVKRLENLKLG